MSLSIVVQILDCGALLLFHFSKIKGEQSTAFEPNPKLVDRLEKQREANKIQDIWKIFPTAVSDQKTELNLIITEVHEKTILKPKKNIFP